MMDINLTIAGWVEDRESMDREIVVLKTQGDTSSLYLIELVKARSELNYQITHVDSTVRR